MNIIGASWRDSTKRQYNVYLSKWMKFCEEKNWTWTHTKAGYVLQFFDSLFYGQHANYNVINSARSALSSVVSLDGGLYSIGTHPLICRYLKGVFHLRPPVPRYRCIWDVSKVLNYLRKQSPAHKLTLKNLSLKVCTLLALVSAQRVQTLYEITLDSLKLSSDCVDINIESLLKQSRPGNVGINLSFGAFSADKRLCILHYLRHYKSRTQEIRGQERGLFITFKRPFHRATKQTISRWIKTTLQRAGIDTNQYTAHSTRAASTSFARSHDIPLATILKQAGWKGEKTFKDFYLKPLEGGQPSFSQAVLESQ